MDKTLPPSYQEATNALPPVYKPSYLPETSSQYTQPGSPSQFVGPYTQTGPLPEHSRLPISEQKLYHVTPNQYTQIPTQPQQIVVAPPVQMYPPPSAPYMPVPNQVPFRVWGKYPLEIQCHLCHARAFTTVSRDCCNCINLCTCFFFCCCDCTSDFVHKCGVCHQVVGRKEACN